MMHGCEKSDLAIVALKPANKAGELAAEPGERRAGPEGNAGQHSTGRTQSRVSVSQVLACIRTAARAEPAHQACPADTRGRSRMRESRTSGSARGALRKRRPYRDRSARHDEEHTSER